MTNDRGTGGAGTGNENASDFAPGQTILGGRFALIECIEPEHPEIGAPAMWMVDGTMASYVAKIWRRGGDDVPIRAVWNHELRSLLKLESIPDAHGHFAHLQAVGADDRGYYIVVDGSGRSLLSDLLVRRQTYPWLRLSSEAARARLWEGLAVIAEALQMLHDHGMLHRALRPECVFSDTTGVCDFRLSGFEWSLRLNASAIREASGRGPIRMRAPELLSDAPAYSMASDWFDFGVLAVELVCGLKSKSSSLEDIYDLSQRIGRAPITAPERRLLRGLLMPNPDERRAYCKGVAGVVGVLARQLAMNERSFDAPLLLAVQTGPGSELAQAVFRITNGGVQPTDAPGQLAFVQGDLGDDAYVTVEARAERGVNYYAVYGRQIVYRVEPFATRDQPPGWRAGFCNRLDRGTRRGGNRVPPGKRIVVCSPKEASAQLADSRARATRWDRIVGVGTIDERKPGDDMLGFLRLTNHLDMLMQAARIWKVRVRQVSGDGNEMAVEALADPNRDELAQALGLDAPSKQMEQIFVDELGKEELEASYVVVDGGHLFEKSRSSIEWVFIEAELTEEGGRRYRFRRDRGQGDQPLGEGYLRAKDLDGSVKLLRRRLRAIEALGMQRIMLQAIEAPGSVSRDTMERIDEHALKGLDDAKRDALRDIWHSQPLFSLQGPPGTGKTTLIERMVSHAVVRDRSAQVLATAQANETVDALAAKLAKQLGESKGRDRPILVRLDDPESPYAPERQVDRLTHALARSELAARAPAHIATRIAELSVEIGSEGGKERADMARLVARGANVVLTSTTARGLEELVHGSKRFDWCIVEETAKAHAFDLVQPMLASHRMLMIGDHEQLPAFNEEIFIDLLGDPERIRRAMRVGSGLVPRKYGFDFSQLEGEGEAEAFIDRCERWRPMVKLFAELFESSYRPVSPDEQGTALVTARRLTKQHRMHPEICDLISTCFYKDLETDKDALAKLRQPDPFGVVDGGWLPDNRIVFVDVGYVQTDRQVRGQDRDASGRRLLSSREEAEVVVSVLQQLQAKGNTSLQVLTPYKDQVRVLRSLLARAQQEKRLPGIEGFAIPGQAANRVATVHGFQGGEADVVVVSLVRNNARSVLGGVGFLSDRALLNVMLSRAKRKLILVGSWAFFQKRVSEEALADKHHPLHPIARVFRELDRLHRAGQLGLVTRHGREKR